ncbi:peroxisomal biogenesis factor 11 [Stachybotrys elegans]|uniref:Peroxisomal biogenesis factor 11 n=1 Tax=Stachybotrys elegans TaxID=80388 RepID=A0A8K0WSS5_9HYPO|nr:peroxisomal biogenesis factor 11 [Stachybotrys elegans]
MTDAEFTPLRRFIKFSTDAYGLERILRLFQACLGLAAAYILPNWSSLLLLSSIFRPLNIPGSLVILARLQSQIGIIRRTIRVFRFLDAFLAAYTLSTSTSTLSLTVSLDIFSNMSNGMYLLLETITIIDALNIPGLCIWEAGYSNVLRMEAQRSWLLALVSGGLAAAIRLAHARAERQAILTKKALLDKEDKDESGEKEKQTKIAEQQALKLQQLNMQTQALGRKIIANMIDILLPGSVIGWTPVSPGTVSLATFITTFITGYDVWVKLNGPK